MKAQCDRCKEIVALEFALADGGIQVACPACGEEYFVARSGPAEETPAPADPPAETDAATATCPKCGEPRGEREACRRCGLVFANWRGDAVTDADIPDAARVLWNRVEEDWDTVGKHDAFIAHCRETGAFAYGAARYRAAAVARPGDPRARAGLDKVRQLAEEVLIRAPREHRDLPEPGKTPLWRTLVLLGFLVALVIAGALLLDHLGKSTHHAAPRRTPAQPT